MIKRYFLQCEAHVPCRSRLALLFLLAVALAACGPLPNRKPIGTPVRPSPTPAPAVLLRASGQGNRVTSHFATPPLGWKARWIYDCTSAGKGWKISMVAHQTRRQFRPSRLPVMSATAGSAQPRGHGTTTLIYRGNMYIVVQAAPECRWTVRVVENVG